MSLKTWKQEFYPITAKQAGRFSDAKAIEHAILKWTGLKESNLKKHGLEQKYYSSISDLEEELKIDTTSCSLCQKYLERHDWCGGCPLYESRDGIRCDINLDGEELSPYQSWSDEQNPYPMINALKKAKKWIEKNS